jgi:hypothetical protein
VTIPPRPVTRRDVKKFTDYCVILKTFWTHYQTIFQGSDLQRELLQNTAHKFFYDLNQLLIDHLILQICKLTDPEITMGKRNLTIPFLVNNADFAATPRDMAKLKKIAARIETFRKRIVPARNKLLAHLDLDAAHGRKCHGAASVAAWRKFWLDLEELVAILYRRYVNGRVPFHLNSIARVSDADQLVEAIKKSTYFHVLLADRDLTRRVADVAFSSKYFRA